MTQPFSLESYLSLTSDTLSQKIEQARQVLGNKLCILGHHYQSDEIIEQVDFTGDSLRLSQLAAQQKQANHIVFCGVHFMAESADILSDNRQRVYLPEMQAGCPMADMADILQVERCHAWLKHHMARFEQIVPVCYVNSTAAIKAFCGRHGGMCCTSSNCRKVFESIWAENPDAIILFLPDQHLARNTACRMGVGLEQMPVWDPQAPGGGLPTEALDTCRMILWKGHCHVHMKFTVEQIEQARRDDPDVKVIVHPESQFEVCNLADQLGSTDQIIRTIEAADPGSSWCVGTEIKLVNRLAERMAPKGVRVRSISPDNSMCFSMARIGLPHLARILDCILEFEKSGDESVLVNQIIVPDTDKVDALTALARMLAVTA